MKYKVFDVIETMDGKKGTIIEEKEILKIIYKSKDVADKN